MVSERACARTFFGIAVLIFASSAAVTIVWCGSMSAMGAMRMPGGWTMSMAWMRMPGQSWPGAAVSFLGMWVVMMAAMMLPSFAPRLWRYRRALGRTRQVHLGRLTALAAAGYFAVLSGVGMAAFPLGIALAAIEMQHPALARCVPVAVGVIVMIAGLLQFTAWKARHLACCREDPAHCETAKHRDIARHSGTATVTAGRAWRYGLKLGLHCSCCCGGATAILLAIGVMDLRTMAAVTAAVTFERVMPAGERSARAIGFAVLGVGLFRVLACVHG